MSVPQEQQLCAMHQHQQQQHPTVEEPDSRANSQSPILGRSNRNNQVALVETLSVVPYPRFECGCPSQHPILHAYQYPYYNYPPPPADIYPSISNIGTLRSNKSGKTSVDLTYTNMNEPEFEKTPVSTRCSFCQASVTTVVSKHLGTLPFLVCSGLWLSSLFLLFPVLCWWVPFVCSPLYDIHHNCPNCDKLLGVKKVFPDKK